MFLFCLNIIWVNIIVYESVKVIWDFEGIYVIFCYIFYVKFVGLIYFGIFGCVLFVEVLDIWNCCEGEFIVVNKLDCEVVFFLLVYNCYVGVVDFSI